MISIVIPTYKQAEYLGEAIESALQQTTPAAEVLVVIDGSPDNSLEIAKKYPVKIISQLNKGLSSARNTGIMNATQPYIAFLDSDDKMRPQYIQRVTEEIQRTNADIIAPSFEQFGVHTGTIILDNQPTLGDFLYANRIGYFSTFRTNALKAVGGYSPRMTWGYEDWHLTINLLSRGCSLVTIPDILVDYRTKESSMIHEAQNHHDELIAQMRKDFKELADKPASHPLIQSAQFNG